MKFTFSKLFRQSDYAFLLQEIGKILTEYQRLSGCQIRVMMSEIHISHPILKKS